uniref:Uncharacterized protein n=1 Tax=Arundo donax TaxID=35708 RepID=A0A0A9FUU6_ARUDO
MALLDGFLQKLERVIP